MSDWSQFYKSETEALIDMESGYRQMSSIASHYAVIIKKYRKALEFYANELNWESSEVRGCCEDHPDYVEPETDKDLGARAREALQEIE